ncbi:hypothetical protein EVAR_49803_1 [Eumeta japonica]|uniref:Uncharacterized protein n=1 Tax=Eumeta variegata TaxID=151549 RepID=A0A4C1XM79_EUMVA|nr:hypothetical protein EVAR_49803_1 [Eumeta japonica]
MHLANDIHYRRRSADGCDNRRNRGSLGHGWTGGRPDAPEVCCAVIKKKEKSSGRILENYKRHAHAGHERFGIFSRYTH